MENDLIDKCVKLTDELAKKQKLLDEANSLIKMLCVGCKGVCHVCDWLKRYEEQKC